MADPFSDRALINCWNKCCIVICYISCSEIVYIAADRLAERLRWLHFIHCWRWRWRGWLLIFLLPVYIYYYFISRKMTWIYYCALCCFGILDIFHMCNLECGNVMVRCQARDKRLSVWLPAIPLHVILTVSAVRYVAKNVSHRQCLLKFIFCASWIGLGLYR